MSSASKSWILLTGFILFYFVYLMFGALVFSNIERPVEERLKDEMQELKREFLNRSCVDEASLEAFLVKVLTANKYGVSILRNTSDSSNWDLASAMFFANTLVTTVGYGHTTPLSDAGKAFSIFYALLGVPFTMLVLTACVQRLMYPLMSAPVGLCQRWGLAPRAASGVHFTILFVFVLLGFFVAPAAVFTAVEESWSMLDAIYFCFISLCTIGLGDYVPGEQAEQQHRELYKIAVMVYLFVGLMMMYLLLRSFHKMADMHGVTTYLQLPRFEEEDQEEDTEEDTESVVEKVTRHRNPSRKADTKPLDPGSQSSYNTISKG